MQTLFQRIQAQQAVIRELENKLVKERSLLNTLEAERINCDHKFSAPLKGYEHEGGMCELCGVGELYAGTLATMKAQLLASIESQRDGNKG